MYSFNFKKKKKGFLILEAALASIVYCMLALGFFTIFSGQFSMIQAGRTALQAQQYAEIDADTLKLLSYDDLTNSTKLSAAGIHTSKALFTAVSGVTDWYDQVTIGNETTVNSDTSSKMRIATIKLYKNGDTLARYSIDVPLSSQGSDTTGKPPVGSILAYYGNLSNIPSNYHLCDGSNGTPDLRDRFIVGAGSSYGLGYTGGSTSHQISTSELPNLADFLNNTIGVRGSNQINDSGNAVSIINWNWEYTKKREGNNHGWFRNSFTTIAWATNYAFDIRPPYYALYYIMRIK